MRPLIGITSELRRDPRPERPWLISELLAYYAERVTQAGGAPVILPLADEASCRDTLQRLDGLILSGGLDIPAEAFGESPHSSVQPMLAERWHSEVLWLSTARDLAKPILGICLGMQIMNVVAGGKLIQDIPGQCPGALTHGGPTGMCQHEVVIVEGTRLASLAPSRRVTVTSSHHQGIKGIPPGYQLAATSGDGIIEAIESIERGFVIGVQWHPERCLDQPDWLLQGFAKHCVARADS